MYPPESPPLENNLKIPISPAENPGQSIPGHAFSPLLFPSHSHSASVNPQNLGDLNYLPQNPNAQLSFPQELSPELEVRKTRKLFIFFLIVSLVFLILTILMMGALHCVMDGPFPTEYYVLGEYLIFGSNSLGIGISLFCIGTETSCKQFFKNGRCSRLVSVFCYLGFLSVIGCNAFILCSLLAMNAKTIVEYVRKYSATHRKIPSTFNLLNIVTHCAQKETTNLESYNLITGCANNLFLIISDEGKAKTIFTDVSRFLGIVTYIQGVYWLRIGIIVTLSIVIVFSSFICLYCYYNSTKEDNESQSRVAPAPDNFQETEVNFNDTHSFRDRQSHPNPSLPYYAQWNTDEPSHQLNMIRLPGSRRKTVHLEPRTEEINRVAQLYNRFQLPNAATTIKPSHPPQIIPLTPNPQIDTSHSPHPPQLIPMTPNPQIDTENKRRISGGKNSIHPTKTEVEEMDEEGEPKVQVTRRSH